MTLEALYSELQRREIKLEVDGDRLLAIDPNHRLSTALDDAIRAHRDELHAGVTPSSPALAPLRDRIDGAGNVAELGLMIEDTEEGFGQGSLTQVEAESLAAQAEERSREIQEERRPKMPSDGGFWGPNVDEYWAGLEAHNRGLTYVPRSFTERERRLRCEAGRQPGSTPIPVGTEEFTVWAQGLFTDPKEACSAYGQRR